MNQTIRVAVIIPAYNEEASIASVVSAVHAASSDSIQLTPVVVNDCSKDSTKEIIGSLNCVALNLPINLGIGGAVQTGIKYAFDNGFDFCVQIDGDGQHPPQFIPVLEKELVANNWDVAIGSRYIEKEGFQSTFMRRTGIQYFQFLLKLITSENVTDSTSGMRMMNRKTMKLLYAYYPDEYPEPEALIIYNRNGLKFGEVPVQMNERMGGQSSIQGFGAVYYMFKVTIAIIFTYLRQ
ncbi:MAG: glycosyltransferase family 2 protein [Bacteroidetes bacterium]|nr:glycosyltransferase family 2 protein [Bacteroidota bacterium]